MSTQGAATSKDLPDAFDFEGARELVRAVDEAVGLEDPDAIADSVKRELSRLISSDGFRLPPALLEPEDDHYARRLIYRDPDNRFSIVAMTWGVGQGTPLHDHAGLWCVEGVCYGRIRIEQFAHRETKGEQDRFRLEEIMTSEVGGAGCLIPPHEHHRILNDREDDVAVTLHIYGGEMETCNVFKPVSGDWYRRECHGLEYDG